MELELPAINTLDEFNILGTPATRIRMPTDGYHWYALDHVFDKAAVVGISATRSEHTIAIKMIFKFGGKIRTLGAKIFQ